MGDQVVATDWRDEWIADLEAALARKDAEFVHDTDELVNLGSPKPVSYLPFPRPPSAELARH
jgi:hypothetical protein